MTSNMGSGINQTELPLNELKAIHQERRRDIDGLRGIAVLAVVAYHFFPDLVPSGFLGVDVFFVISGFVITNLLMRQQPMDFKDLSLFWGHRVRRLFPALTVVIAVSLVVGWVVLWPVQFNGLSSAATWSAVMLGNIYAFNQTGYFASEPTWNPLLNLWSLGVEEQFYLVWPLLLGAMWWASRKKRWILVAGVLLVTILSWFSGYSYGRGEAGGSPESAVFYLPWFRAWELLAGALVALALLTPSLKSLLAAPHAKRFFTVSYVVVFVILAAALFWTYQSQRPSDYALTIVVMTSLALTIGSSVPVSNSLSGNSFLLGVGKISYPLYLWHWPILALGLAVGIAQSVGSKLMLVAVSVVLAIATRYLIENPIQRRPVSRRLVVVLIASLVCTVLVGTVLSRTSLNRLNDQDLVAQLANFTYETQPDYDIGGCFIEGGDGQSPDELSACIPMDGQAQDVLVWGDSHAASMMAGIRKALPGKGISQLTMAGCFPSLREDADQEACNVSNELALKAIKDGKFSSVVLAAWWRDEYDASKLVRLIDEIQQTSDSKIVVVGPLPRWSPALNRIWTPDEISKFERLPLYTKTGLLDDPVKFDVAFKRVLRGLDVTYVSPIDFLCNENGCRVSVDGTPQTLTAWDYGHLTRAGSELLGPAITASLK